MIFIGYLDLVLFALCAFTVVYLLIYAIAATVKRTDKYSESRIKHRFAILIPAYKDDEYVFYAIRSFLQQDYPIDCFDIIVISDLEIGNQPTVGPTTHHIIKSQL